MTRDDKNYFLARAEQEIESAQRSDRPEAVRAHYVLAELYLGRVYGTDEIVREAADLEDAVRL